MLERHRIQASRRIAFESEQVLVGEFAALLRFSYLSRPTGFLREFDSGSGIADFVLYTLHDRFVARAPIAEIGPRYLYAVHALPLKQTFSEELFARKVLASETKARFLLGRLADLGYCKPIRRGMWQKIRNPQPVVRHLCAVEAKLSNWRKALHQANQYRDFANQAWVLLDDSAMRVALENIDAFEMFNIGLALIAAEKRLEFVFVPQMQPPRNPLRYWEANGKIAQRLLRASGSQTRKNRTPSR